MIPIQLWLPMLHGGVRPASMRRDMQRAFRAWNGDDIVWAVPEWCGPARWNENGLRVLCVAAENLECIRVCHVGANGAIVGPGAAAFPDMSVNGLLDAWLAGDVQRVVPVTPGETYQVSVPVAVDGGVGYERREVYALFANSTPIVGTDAANREVRLGRPPPFDTLSPVSPELESTQGPPRIAPSEGALPSRIGWLSPFDAIMPWLSTLDDIDSRRLMREIASSNDLTLAEVMRTADIEARDWLSSAHSTVSRAWFQPILSVAREQSALVSADVWIGVE